MLLKMAVLWLSQSEACLCYFTEVDMELLLGKGTLQFPLVLYTVIKSPLLIVAWQTRTFKASMEETFESHSTLHDVLILNTLVRMRTHLQWGLAWSGALRLQSFLASTALFPF